jgi:hypothetical protein
MPEEGRSHLRFIDRERRRIEVTDGSIIHSYPLNAIPDLLFEALASLAEKESDIDGLEHIQRATVHQPVANTSNAEGPFPVNSANKRVRLALLDEVIDNDIDELEGRVLALMGQSTEDNIEERMELYRDLFLDDSKIDRFMLGSMEMYGGITHRNIVRDPRVSLSFSWYRMTDPRNVGLQVNCIAEIIPPEDPFYRYMGVMLYLHGKKYLDLRQAKYPCAYKFWISEVKEKSLSHREGFY